MGEREDPFGKKEIQGPTLRIALRRGLILSPREKKEKKNPSARQRER